MKIGFIGASTVAQAADQDIVILAVKWSSVQTALFAVADWSGRILVDATNRVSGYKPLSLGHISGRTTSEIVADLAPGSRVVKAFNPVPLSRQPGVAPYRASLGPWTATRPDRHPG